MKKLHLMILGLNIFWLNGEAFGAIAHLHSQAKLNKYNTPAVPSQESTKSTLFDLTQFLAAKSPFMTSANTISVADFDQNSILGHLGHPLGKIITISGVIRQAALGAKSTSRELVLSIEAVNDQPLVQPVIIEFNLFMTAQVAAPILGQSFKYVGYETGGFTGVPQEAFKFVPAVATTSHHFNSFFQVLREELDIVKTKSDLIKFNNRRVQVVGRYVSKTRPAPSENTGIAGFKGTYITAKIVLDDKTEIPIFPTYNKQSLRSPQEAKAYDGKIVKVVGKIEIERDQKLNPDQRSTFISMDGIWTYQSP